MSTSTNPTASKATGNARFNSEAAQWDSNPFVHQMSAEAWRAIQLHVPFFQDSDTPSKLDVLEIGCGTGLLTMLVAPSVRKVVAVDAAEGMIEVLNAKVRSGGVQNVMPLAALLEDPEDERLPAAREDDEKSGGETIPHRQKFDLVLSHLVLHHIPDLTAVLRTMFGCLKPGGMIALTDFEDFGPEARRFHPEFKMGGVERHGIGREWIEGLMKEVGFVDERAVVAWEHEKRVERWVGEFGSGGGGSMDGKGEMMKFSYLVCLGRRP